MTREEAKEFMWVENHKNPSVIKWQHHKTIRELVENLIDKIYNDHETTIGVLMKANEEEISRHFNEYEKYEAQLKTKDEKIHYLKTQMTGYSMMFNEPQKMSCVGCVREAEDMVDPHCAFCSRACEDNYEAKDTK